MMKSTARPPLSTPARRHCQMGHTLLEMLVVIGILGILVKLSAPGLTAFVSAQRASAAARELFTHLASARSYAVMFHEHVVVCASSDGSMCANHDDWSHGWIMFVDENRNRQRQVSEKLLRTVELGSNPKTPLVFIAGANKGRYVRYRSTGDAWPNGRFKVCARESALVLHDVIVYRTGRSRIARPQVPKDPTCVKMQT